MNGRVIALFVKAGSRFRRPEASYMNADCRGCNCLLCGLGGFLRLPGGGIFEIPIEIKG